jgi:hypothetical protein
LRGAKRRGNPDGGSVFWKDKVSGKAILAEGVMESRAGLDVRILDILTENEHVLGLEEGFGEIPGRFIRLIQAAKTKFGQRAVILVDEYDKPILDNLTKPDLAIEMRDGLRNFYSVIKGQDAHVKFALLTGVSKFSKVNIFSGLNNLKDITLNAEYSNICGNTDADVDTVFAPSGSRPARRLFWSTCSPSGKSICLRS